MDERTDERMGEGERSRAEKDRRVTLFFLALQRHADVGRRKKTTEKLKWTPAGISTARSAREMEFLATERHTAFVIIKFAGVAVAIAVGWKFS